MSRNDNLPPGVSVMDEHINPSEEYDDLPRSGECYFSLTKDRTATTCLVHGDACEPQHPGAYGTIDPTLWLMRAIVYVETDNTFSESCRKALLEAVAALDEEYSDACASAAERRQEDGR